MWPTAEAARRRAAEAVTTTAEEKSYEGIVRRHSRACGKNRGGLCSCRPSWQAWVWSSRDKRKIPETFPTLAAAKAWRADALGEVRRGRMRAPTRTTLREAPTALVEGARTGTIKNRKGQPYEPSVVRSYERALGLHVLPDLGGARLSALTRFDLQDLVDRLDAQGLDGSSVRNVLNPLRVIYRRALARGEVAVNPTAGLELPAASRRPRRIASPEAAHALLAALPKEDAAAWATAFYAGLRLGELLALRIADVDLGASLIHVGRSWGQQVQGLHRPEVGRRLAAHPACPDSPGLPRRARSRLRPNGWPLVRTRRGDSRSCDHALASRMGGRASCQR